MLFFRIFAQNLNILRHLSFVVWKKVFIFAPQNEKRPAKIKLLDLDIILYVKIKI